MLLRKIKTRGFLGHLGAASASENGKPAFVELDFTDAELSLVHGANGAGKSTVWDALLFCFFKEHRGGGSNFTRLIHDRADEAEIAVEFELENQIWEIYSRINKTKKGTANVFRYVRLTNGIDNFATKAESDDAVEAWVQQNLKMSAQTFMSAVLLRQGEADRFLRKTTKPKERKEILLELLQLDFYRKLNDAATKCCGEHKKTAKRLDEELTHIRSEAPDQAALAAQQLEIERIETAIEESDSRQTDKRKELDDAQRAEKFGREIARIEALQAADKRFTDRALEIRQKFDRLCELRTLVLQLEKLWDAKSEFSSENENLQKCLGEIERLAADLQQSAVHLTHAEKAAETAERELGEANQVLQATTRAHSELTAKLREIAELEKLEAAIAKHQNELAPFQMLLSNRHAIRENAKSYDFLREAARLLGELRRTQTDLQTAEQSAARINDELRQKETTCHEIAAVVEQLTARLAEAETAKSNLQIELSECQSDLRLLVEKFKNRNSLTGEIECPTCGTTLDDQRAERLAAEIGATRISIGKLEAREIELKNRVAQNESDARQLKVEKNAREVEAKKIGNEATRLRFASEQATNEIENRRRLFEAARQNAGEAARDDQVDLEVRLARLENAPHEFEQLENAERLEENINAVVKNLCEQASRWNFSIAERAETKRATADCAVNLPIHEANQKTTAADFDERTRICNDLRQKIGKLEIAVETRQENLNDLQTRFEAARQKVDSARRNIAPEDAERQNACEDKSVFERLQTELGDLKSCEAESRSLSDAEARQNQLEGEKDSWQKQLKDVLPEHRRPAEAVETELRLIGERLILERENLKIAEQDLCAMKERLAHCCTKQNEFADAAKTAGLWSKLADAFGKKGLEARIVQSAQETVKQNANTILQSLSGGAFQIELEETAGDELQILVRDLSTQNGADKARPFEFFCGGESLLIAVSLAVAIGQAVTGNTAANTLIIDEGFGALDNNRRELLVEELRRLSREVLQNGRVIVVSHQDDVKEKFSNRFLISKNDNGMTGVEIYGKV